MAVVACITKLVQTGKITKALGDEALDLYERSKGEYIKNMGPADAEAAAALAAARSLEAGAKRLKNDVAKQAIAFANFERTMLDHPDGPIAGVMDQLTQSLRSRGTRNVDAVRDDIWNQMASKFGEAMEKFSPGILGPTKEQLASAKNLIREGFGVKTGDNLAASASKSFNEVREYGEARARSAGKNFEPNENWRFPQPWNTNQVRKVDEATFVREFIDEIANGGISRLWDTRTNLPASAAEHEFILKRAYADITGTGGGVGTFSPSQRTFEFAEGSAGAESWLRLQGKYGVGDNVMGLITGHMNKMATEIAMAEVIGPNHRAIIAAVTPRLKAAEAQLKGAAKFAPSVAGAALMPLSQLDPQGRRHFVRNSLLTKVLVVLIRMRIPQTSPVRPRAELGFSFFSFFASRSSARANDSSSRTLRRSRNVLSGLRPPGAT